MPTTYPTAEDLEAILASGGIEDLDPVQTEQAVLAGISTFEGMVDRKMLAGNPVTRFYGPPDNQFGLLDLEDDLAALTSVVYQPQNALAETLLPADYRLEPQNALARSQPYRQLVLRRRFWTPYGFGYGASLQVTGAWGYAVSIPDDAWRAMLNLGVLWLIDMHLISLTGFLVSWKEEDVAENYNPKPGAYAEGLRSGVDAAVTRYRKASII